MLILTGNANKENHLRSIVMTWSRIAMIILQKDGFDLPCRAPCQNHSRRDRRRSSRMRFQKQAEDWYPSPQMQSPCGLLDSHFENVLAVLLAVDLYNPYISPVKRKGKNIIISNILINTYHKDKINVNFKKSYILF